jgi:hypothetical protein
MPPTWPKTYSTNSQNNSSKKSSHLGAVESSHEVSGETQLVDVYFVPNPQPTVIPSTLGILDRIIQTPCLLEPFRKQPTPNEIRSCLLKLFQVHGDYHRQARREENSFPETQLLPMDSGFFGLHNPIGALRSLHPCGLGKRDLFSAPQTAISHHFH